MALNSLSRVCERIEGCGDVAVEVTPCMRNCVRESIRRERDISMRRLKLRRKSAPRIGGSTSARMKTQRKVRLSPRSRERDRVPYVAMGEPLTACKVKLWWRLRSAGEGGKTLMYPPGSGDCGCVQTHEKGDKVPGQGCLSLLATGLVV